MKTEAAKDRDDFQQKNADFDHERACLLTKATDEAKQERERLLDKARQSADALGVKRQEQLRTETGNLHQALARRTQQEVFSIARQTLTDLANTTLEERMVTVFKCRLQEMDGDAKQTLAAALKSATEPAVVRSAFDLPTEERDAVQKVIDETFSLDVQLRFETAPDVISGIELNSNGQKVAWSIADYLSSLDKEVDELLKQPTKPQPKAKATAQDEAAPKPETKQ